MICIPLGIKSVLEMQHKNNINNINALSLYLSKKKPTTTTISFYRMLLYLLTSDQVRLIQFGKKSNNESS